MYMYMTLYWYLRRVYDRKSACCMHTCGRVLRSLFRCGLKINHFSGVLKMLFSVYMIQINVVCRWKAIEVVNISSDHSLYMFLWLLRTEMFKLQSE